MPILDLFESYPNLGINDNSWLICGKGPSFNDLFLKDSSRTSYNILTLNETIREIPAIFSHIIDTEVLKNIKSVLEKQARYLVMPYYPHFACRFNPGLSIERLIELNWYPILRAFSEQGRLLCYNLSTATSSYIRKNSPIINASYYSLEAALNLLVLLGIKEIRTAGIDGGNHQSPIFNDLANTNLERGYDKQWKGVRKTLKKFPDLIFGPLNTELPCRIFVGCSESEEIPYQVLKYSIESHKTISTKIEPLRRWSYMIPSSNSEDGKQRTPFSFQRFLIPQLCDYKGYAIYLDSDMQVFSDIKELWEMDMEDSSILTPRGKDTNSRKAQFSVMKMDCSKLEWNIDEIVRSMDDGLLSYSQVLHEMIIAPAIYENACPEWNSLEDYLENETKLLHYTDFHTQPWKQARHSLARLWEKCFRNAYFSGYFSKYELLYAIKKGFVRNSLLSVLDSSQDKTLSSSLPHFS